MARLSQSMVENNENHWWFQLSLYERRPQPWDICTRTSLVGLHSLTWLTTSEPTLHRPSLVRVMIGSSAAAGCGQFSGGDTAGYTRLMDSGTYVRTSSFGSVPSNHVPGNTTLHCRMQCYLYSGVRMGLYCVTAIVNHWLFILGWWWSTSLCIYLLRTADCSPYGTQLDPEHTLLLSWAHTVLWLRTDHCFFLFTRNSRQSHSSFQINPEPCQSLSAKWPIRNSLSEVV